MLEKSCHGRLLIENRPIAEMRAWEQVTLYLARDQYSIAYTPGGLCQGNTVAIEVQVQADETRTFQIQNGSNGNFAIIENRR